MTSPNSIYIPIGLTYKDFRAEYFATYINSRSGSYLCKQFCFPQKYTENEKK